MFDTDVGCCWPLLLSAPTLTLTFAVEVTRPGEATPPGLMTSRGSWKEAGIAVPPPVRLLNVNGHV